MDTNMVRRTFGRTMSEVSEGVDSLEFVATSPDLDGVSGRYFDQVTESEAEPQAYDPEARRRLWELSEELCGGKFEV
jgi:hypothetical protein